MAQARLRTEIIWNVASFAVLGASGIAMNFLIGNYYDAAALGVFNQVFATYIFASQFAVGGIHLSAQRHLSHELDATLPERSSIALASLLLTLAIAFVFALGFWLSAPWVGRHLLSQSVGQGMKMASLGLFFFALNKVQLGVLNGHRHMRAYALFNSLRYILMIGAIFLAKAWQWPATELSWVFSFSESILFVCLGAYCLPFYLRPNWLTLKSWAHTHLSFGFRGLGSGVLTELNTRVDILLLGYFTTDATVGAYSMPALLVEGIFQLPSLIRANYNPLIAGHFARNEKHAIATLIRKGATYTYALMAVLCVVALALYPIMMPLLTHKIEFIDTWGLFAILLAGVWVASGFSPFYNLLLQAGYPGLYTWQMALLVGLNAGLNCALIPLWGNTGSAIATALAWASSVPLLLWMAKRYLKITNWPL